MLPHRALGPGFKYEEKEDLGMEAEGLCEPIGPSCVGDQEPDDNVRQSRDHSYLHGDPTSHHLQKTVALRTPREGTLEAVNVSLCSSSNNTEIPSNGLESRRHKDAEARTQVSGIIALRVITRNLKVTFQGPEVLHEG